MSTPQEDTQDAVLALTQAARARGQSAATVLLLGKGGVGKSATVNSMLGEKAAVVSTFQPAGAKPARFTRTLHDGFALTVVDTPSLLEQDAVSVAVRMRVEWRRPVAPCCRDAGWVPRGISMPAACDGPPPPPTDVCTPPRDARSTRWRVDHS